MNQMTLDDLLEVEPVNIPELICCSLSEDFHWLKITNGYTPEKFRENIDFAVDGYENLYIRTNLRDTIISEFKGEVLDVQYVGGG